MTLKYLKKIDVILFENCQGMNPMGLSAPWGKYKNNQYLQTWKWNKQLYDVTQKKTRD